MASAAAAADVEVADGPVMNLMSKRLRALRKKYNRILQMEERVAQGKPLQKEQEEVLRSKPAVATLIEEYEKLRQPLSSALQEELSLSRPSSSSTTTSDTGSPSPSPSPAPPVAYTEKEQEQKQVQDQRDEAAAAERAENQPDHDPDAAVEDLLNLLYFGCLFDVKPQSEFASTMFTRTHERGCCLTYDYVTDDATDLLRESDLDLISTLGGLVISRPTHSGDSHKNALLSCLEHAKLWLCNSDQPIQPGSSITYKGLRERLNRILASDYCTTTPELKAPVDVAAAVGKYATCQVQVTGSTSVQVEAPPAHHQHKDNDPENFEMETGHNQSHLVDDPPEMAESDALNPSVDTSSVQQEQHPTQVDEEQSQKDAELKEQQYVPRRAYQNQRGGNRGGGGGGRRGYANGRGGRGGRGGGGYQNGRSQYNDPAYYPRNYYNSRGRGSRAGGSAMYHHNHGAVVHGGHVPADVELGVST